MRDDEAPKDPEPLSKSYPCTVCGAAVRWDDHGVWRCVRCWPYTAMKKQDTPHTFPEETRP